MPERRHREDAQTAAVRAGGQTKRSPQPGDEVLTLAGWLRVETVDAHGRVTAGGRLLRFGELLDLRAVPVDGSHIPRARRRPRDGP